MASWGGAGLYRAVLRYTALYRARHRVALGAAIGGAVVAPVRYMVALDGIGTALRCGVPQQLRLWL